MENEGLVVLDVEGWSLRWGRPEKEKEYKKEA